MIRTIDMDDRLAELKKQFEEIAGRWNGKTPKGEDEALAATDILDLIESIENEEADYERIGNDIKKDKDKLEEMVKDFNL